MLNLGKEIKENKKALLKAGPKRITQDRDQAALKSPLR